MQTLIHTLSQLQISEFFSENAPPSQTACDQHAAHLLNTPSVRPAQVQGSTSYTVVPFDDNVGHVVQFRTPEYAFDLDFLGFVERTYGERFVPRHRCVGALGGLLVYSMNDVRGVSVYLARERLRADGGWRLRTAVRDFAM